MGRAKVIDRLELTRKNSRLLRNNDAPKPEIPNVPEEERHGTKCPKCGQYTVHHVEGCETCASCGWSACSYVW